MTHETAVAALKATKEQVRLMVAKSYMSSSVVDGALPHSQSCKHFCFDPSGCVITNDIYCYEKLLNLNEHQLMKPVHCLS